MESGPALRAGAAPAEAADEDVLGDVEPDGLGDLGAVLGELGLEEGGLLLVRG